MADINNELLARIVQGVVQELLKQAAGGDDFVKHVDPSGVIHVQSSTVKCERFEQDGVALKDILTLEESPRMGAGIMELDHTSFEWTLDYDEFDYVIEGDLEIEINGNVVAGKPGDIIYIPKGSHIHFQTPNFTRYAYFVYPADWNSN